MLRDIDLRSQASIFCIMLTNSLRSSATRNFVLYTDDGCHVFRISISESRVTSASSTETSGSQAGTRTDCSGFMCLAWPCYAAVSLNSKNFISVDPSIARNSILSPRLMTAVPPLGTGTLLTESTLLLKFSTVAFEVSLSVTWMCLRETKEIHRGCASSSFSKKTQLAEATHHNRLANGEGHSP